MMHRPAIRAARSRPRYPIDFAEHMQLCEVNYLRLGKLLPVLSGQEQHVFGVTLPGGLTARVAIAVVERSPYTDTLILSRDAQAEWLKARDLVVRLYHDARVAEVIAGQGGQQLDSFYRYPNPDMYMSDEKVQLNRFLGEWLGYCLEFGHSLHEIALAE